jgi:hypothetical protein
MENPRLALPRDSPGPPEGTPGRVQHRPLLRGPACLHLGLSAGRPGWERLVEGGRTAAPQPRGCRGRARKPPKLSRRAFPSPPTGLNPPLGDGSIKKLPVPGTNTGRPPCEFGWPGRIRFPEASCLGREMGRRMSQPAARTDPPRGFETWGRFARRIRVRRFPEGPRRRSLRPSRFALDPGARPPSRLRGLPGLKRHPLPAPSRTGGG